MLKKIFSVYKKEIGSFFNSSIAYVFLILFITVPFFVFFTFFGGVFEENVASMRRYFEMIPFVFIIFIPGLTMGSWAKENNEGTLELLFTLPVSEGQVLVGKFLSAVSLVAIALSATLIVPIMTHITLGEFDWGQVFTQYMGALLLACTYIAISFFFSSLTMELINAFLISAVVLFLLAVVGFLPGIVQFPEWLGWLKSFFIWICTKTHFDNFSKGVIDSKDIIYYLSLTVIFFYLNLRSLESRKWS